MDKSVFIVGASSGIGFALAKEFARKGYKVYAGSRNVSKMSPLSELGVKTFSLDVTSKESIESAKKFIEEDNGGELDILYLNAGIVSKGTLFDIDMEQVELAFKTNVFGPLMVLQSFHRLLLRSQGTVAFTSSVVVYTRMPFMWPYTSTKTAFDQLAQQLVVEAGQLGIKVVNIRTGAVESNIWAPPYVPPASSIYYQGEGVGLGVSVNPSKSPADPYAQKVVRDIERAIKRKRVYTCITRGGTTTIAWIIGLLPLVKVAIPLMFRMLKLTDIFANVKRRVASGKF